LRRGRHLGSSASARRRDDRQERSHRACPPAAPPNAGAIGEVVRDPGAQVAERIEPIGA
jgi:hypothetical protein